MANSEVALDVKPFQEDKTRSWVVEERSTLETPPTAKDGGTTRKWPSYNTIFDPKGKFLPMWNKIFVISCVFAVSFDPLFFYIPIMDEKNKCLKFDKRLKAITLVLRPLSDLLYIADIIMRILTTIPKVKPSADSGATKTQDQEAPNSKAKKSVEDVLAIAKRLWPKTNRPYILIDIFAILPLPQVGILVFFSKMKGRTWLRARKLFDTLILLQFVPRVLPIYFMCRVRNKTLNKAGMWTKGVFNFFLYILASHVLGAFWYFFAIQRKMDCWYQFCQNQNGCQPSTFTCSERGHRWRNITMLNTSCPIKLPDPGQETPFDFGIFGDAIYSDIVRSVDFPHKYLNCFWWGLRNLSSYGQNLKTSTYAWENLFAVLISITGLLLFIYLIGNLQAYLQFATTRSEKLRRKMKTKKLEVDLWLSRKGLPSNLKEVIMHFIQQELEQNKDVQVESILCVLPSAQCKYIKRYLRLATLKKVPMLQTMGVKLLKAICVHLKTVDYAEDSCIIGEGDQLTKMIFITHGTVQTYKTNGKGGKIGSKFLEKGDFYGADELLDWASKFSSFDNVPTSMRMVKPVTKVEAFELSADDLKSVAIKYWWHFTRNKELHDFNGSLLEEFAEASIEQEIRRQNTIKQAKKNQTFQSLKNLGTTSGSKMFQQVVSNVMRDQLPPPVCALEGSLPELAS